MTSRIMVLGALALACILAAGGGAYLAVRQGLTPTQATTPVASQPVAGTPLAAAPSAPADLMTTPPAAGDTDTAPVATSPAQPAPDKAQAGTDRAHGSRSASKERNASRAASRRADETSPQPVPVADAPDTSAARPGAAAAGAQDVSNQAATAAQPQSVTQEPQRELVEVTVPSESVLGLQIQNAVSSETARVEDRVDARVTRDVRVGERVAIPAGSQAIGSVVEVERGGKVKDRAHIAIRFNTLILPDGSRLTLVADAVHREGPSPANKSAAKIGGATVGGAILGAILGGGKGAAIGGAIGAGGGTAATMIGDRQPATLPAGSIVNVRLMSPVTVTLER